MHETKKFEAAGWLILIAIAILSYCAYSKFYSKKHQLDTQLFNNLNGAVQTGIEIQAVVDEFKRQAGSYPTCIDLSNVLQSLYAFNDGVTPYNSNKIIPVFDNSGGWVYDPRSGVVKINYNGKYAIGSQTWVDLSKIDFHAETKVVVNGPGKTQVLDYSYLSMDMEPYKPDIASAISNSIARKVNLKSRANE